MHSVFCHWTDNWHILCSRWNARYVEDNNKQDTITLFQDPFSRHSDVIWSSEWLGWWATIQSLRRRAWLAKPKSARLQSRLSFSDGNNGTRQETKTNTQPQTKQTQWMEGWDYNLMNGECAGPLHRLLEGQSWAETSFRCHSLWNGLTSWRTSVAGWDLAKRNWHLAFK